MANNVQNRGFDPEWQQGGSPDTLPKFPLKGTLTLAIFKNSPFFISAGVADSCSTGADPIVKGVDGVTGSVCVIYGADGFPIHNIGTTATGCTIEGTMEADQKYRITTVASATAVTQAKMGMGANFTTEASTAGTATYGSLAAYGSNYSSRNINPANFITVANTNDIAHASQLVLLSKTPMIVGNDFTAAVADGAMELWCTINPYAYVS